MEAKVGDFVQVGAGSIINPGVEVEEDVFIGSGVTIVGGITIGKGSRIGAGSVVVTPVKAGETVFGNPAQNKYVLKLVKSKDDMPRIPESDLILNSDGSVYHLNLLPKHISETIITVGDPSRVYRVSQYFDDVEFEMNKREFITHVGKYKGKRVTVISTGIGTDNIEIFFTELDALINVDLKTGAREAGEKK